MTSEIVKQEVSHDFQSLKVLDSHQRNECLISDFLWLLDNELDSDFKSLSFLNSEERCSRER